MFDWIKGKKWVLLNAVLLGVLVSVLGIQVADENGAVNRSVRIGVGNEKVITLGHIAYAAGSVDYTYDGVGDNVQFQAALDALPATGGRIVDVSAVQKNFSATVTRAIANVVIVGAGQGSYFVNDGVTALFTAGGNNWKFQDLRTDAGGITLTSTNNWTLENVYSGTDYTSFYTGSGSKPVGSRYISQSESTADHIVYQDSTGFHALRTEDGTITQSNATNAVTVINNLLASLDLTYTPGTPNPYVKGSNPNGFKEGRRVYVNIPVLGTANTTLIIPPNQDFTFDMGTSVLNYAGSGYAVTIDSSMNSLFNLGIIVGQTSTGLVRVYPYTVGPDNLTVVTTSRLNIEALVGSGYGLILDGTTASIQQLIATVNEVNLGTAPKGDGIYIPDPSPNNVTGNRITINRTNDATNILNIGATTLVKSNLFYIDRSIVTRPIVDGSSGLNSITTMESSGGLTFNSPTIQGVVSAGTGLSMPYFTPTAEIEAALLRAANILYIPTLSGWTVTVNGTGGTSQEIVANRVNTGATASSNALLYAGLGGFSRSAGSQGQIDWSGKIYLIFGYSRNTDDAQVIARFQLKDVITGGVLTDKGIGIRVDDKALKGESYGSSLGVVDLGMNVIENIEYQIVIVHTPAVPKIEWFVNGVLKGTQTTAANIPGGVSTSGATVVHSIIRGVTGAADSTSIVYMPKIWQVR